MDRPASHSEIIIHLNNGWSTMYSYAGIYLLNFCFHYVSECHFNNCLAVFVFVPSTFCIIKDEYGVV